MYYVLFIGVAQKNARSRHFFDQKNAGMRHFFQRPEFCMLLAIHLNPLGGDFPPNAVIRFKDETFSIVAQLFTMNSQKADQQWDSRNPTEFVITSDVSRASVAAFVDACQGKRCGVTEEIAFDFCLLCDEWRADRVKDQVTAWMAKYGPRLLIRRLLFELSRDMDTSSTESKIREDFARFIDDPALFELPVNVLDRLMGAKMSNLDFLMKCLEKFERLASPLFSKLEWEGFSPEILRRLARDDRLNWSCLGDKARKMIDQLVSSIESLTAENEQLVSRVRQSREERAVLEKKLADGQELFETCAKMEPRLRAAAVLSEVNASSGMNLIKKVEEVKRRLPDATIGIVMPAVKWLCREVTPDDMMASIRAVFVDVEARAAVSEVQRHFPEWDMKDAMRSIRKYFRQLGCGNVMRVIHSHFSGASASCVLRELATYFPGLNGETAWTAVNAHFLDKHYRVTRESQCAVYQLYPTDFPIVSDNPLKGIVARIAGLNDEENSIVVCSASSTEFGRPRHIEIFCPSRAPGVGPDRGFRSQITPSPQWLCYDFTLLSVTPTHYSIRTCPTGSEHMKDWALEGRMSDGSWLTLDTRVDNDDLNGNSRIATFAVSSPQTVIAVRILQTGPNHAGNNRLTLSAFELFGRLGS
jgi:hypothetical protein